MFSELLQQPHPGSTPPRLFLIYCSVLWTGVQRLRLSSVCVKLFSETQTPLFLIINVIRSSSCRIHHKPKWKYLNYVQRYGMLSSFGLKNTFSLTFIFLWFVFWFYLLELFLIRILLLLLLLLDFKVFLLVNIMYFRWHHQFRSHDLCFLGTCCDLWPFEKYYTQ